VEAYLHLLHIDIGIDDTFEAIIGIKYRLYFLKESLTTLADSTAQSLQSAVAVALSYYAY